MVGAPGGGLDPSWHGALYMATERGMHFGTQLVFTFGPLGFLSVPELWYRGLATAALAFQGALHLLLCVALVYSLRRHLGLVHFRYATINGTRQVILVPGTATDGLLFDLSPEVDYPAPFALSPNVHTVSFIGRQVRIDLYRLQVSASWGPNRVKGSSQRHQPTSRAVRIGP